MKIVNKQAKLNVMIILIYLLYFSIIYQTGTVPAALRLETPTITITRIIMLIVPFFMIASISDLKKGLLLSVIMLIGIGLNTALYLNSTLQLTYKAILLLMFYLAIGYMTRHKISIDKILYNLILSIIVITLILYTLIEVLHLDIPYQLIRNNGSYYYKDYFHTFYSYHKGFLPRLSGLFWEPGMYAVYLNLALFYYIYNHDVKKKKWQLIVILISVLLAQSAAGYCVTVLLLALTFTKTEYFNRYDKQLLVIIAGIVTIVVIIAIIIDKRETNSTNLNAYSFGLRVNDILSGLKIFVKHPVIGIGFGNDEMFRNLNSLGRGSSNGLVSWLYMTGIVGAVFVLFPFIVNIKNKSLNIENKQTVWLIIIIIFNMCEPIYELPLMPYFLAFEYYKYFNFKVRRSLEYDLD